MRVARNIVLVGFMGTGKSSVGRQVARRLGRRFIDLDAEIVRASGRPIPQIFSEEGEVGFRMWERRVVRQFALPAALVVATGGGMVLDARNTDTLAEGGVLICLDASVESILGRVGHDHNRPLLQHADRERRIRELLEKRQPLYAAIPLHVDTDGLTRKEVADRVIALAGQSG